MKSFLFGFGLGIGLGVLFAPMSGEQTRRNITERANDLADSAREMSNQVGDRVRGGISQIRSTVSNVTGGANVAGERPTGTESIGGV